jgi:hypothetical protein
MDLWSEVLTKLSEKISKPSFETWFAGTEAEIIGETLLIKPKIHLRQTGYRSDTIL